MTGGTARAGSQGIRRMCRNGASKTARGNGIAPPLAGQDLGKRGKRLVSVIAAGGSGQHDFCNVRQGELLVRAHSAFTECAATVRAKTQVGEAVPLPCSVKISAKVPKGWHP